MKVVSLTLLLALSGSARAAPDHWVVAEKAVRRLPPSVFDQLPRKIVTYLTERGCMVPQSFVRPQPHNVISGDFFGHGHKDWAVVCSHKDQSTLLLFSQGATRPKAELATADDESYLQDIGAGRIGYSRLISTVGRRNILQHYRWYGGPKPPPINHQGIDDGFAEKASTIHYYYRGHWLELTGAN